MGGALAWLSDRSDRRVQAGLERACPMCHVRAGRECGWWRGGHFWRLDTGVIHQVRVPKSEINRRSA